MGDYEGYCLQYDKKIGNVYYARMCVYRTMSSRIKPITTKIACKGRFSGVECPMLKYEGE